MDFNLNYKKPGDVFTFSLDIKYSFENGVTFHVSSDDGFTYSACSLRLAMLAIQERFNKMVFQTSLPY